MPALPAYVMLVAALPLLVPTLPTRLGATLRPIDPPRGVSSRTALVVTALLALVPLLVVVTATPQEGPAKAVVVNDILVPVDAAAIGLTATRVDGSVVLRWREAEGRTRPFYVVFRSEETDVTCETEGAARCELSAAVLGVTRETRLVDDDPGRRPVYRVGVAANWVDDPEQGDVFLVSQPVAP